MYDLHCHSLYSDGIQSVKEIVTEAKMKGLKGFALTDHDTMEGCREGEILAKKEGLDFIPGIEFGVEYKKKEVHILAYFVDPEDDDLVDLVHQAKEDRIRRITSTVDLLQKDGFDITLEEVKERTQENMSRSHIGWILMEKNYAKSMKDAFQKYLNPGRKYYIPKKAIVLEEVLGTLKRGGYLSSLAHPITLGDDEIVEEILGLGVDALEVVNEKMSFQQSLKYLKLAEKWGIPITGGSDCHGRFFDGEKYFGNYTIGDWDMKRLREAL